VGGCPPATLALRESWVCGRPSGRSSTDETPSAFGSRQLTLGLARDLRVAAVLVPRACAGDCAPTTLASRERWVTDVLRGDRRPRDATDLRVEAAHRARTAAFGSQRSHRSRLRGWLFSRVACVATEQGRGRPSGRTSTSRRHRPSGRGSSFADGLRVVGGVEVARCAWVTSGLRVACVRSRSAVVERHGGQATPRGVARYQRGKPSASDTKTHGRHRHETRPERQEAESRRQEAEKA
jgi:hypothetical protein